MSRVVPVLPDSGLIPTIGSTPEVCSLVDGQPRM